MPAPPPSSPLAGRACPPSRSEPGDVAVAKKAPSAERSWKPAATVREPRPTPDGTSLLAERLRRAELRAKAFQEVGLALGSTLDLDQLLELILRKTAELLEADRATLYLLDEQRGRLLSRIVIGDQTQSIELPVGEGIAGVVAKLGQPIRVRDAYRDKRFNKGWDELTGYRTRSILAAPMKNHVGRTIGVIQVLNKRSATEVEFTAHDEELMGALATQAAISIDNSRLFLSVIQKNMQLVETKEQLEQRVADLKLLFELESAMGQATTLSDLARAVIVEAARACEAEGGGLLVDEGEEGVWLYHLDTADRGRDGDGPPEVRRVALKRGEGIIGLAMRTNQSQYWVQGAGSLEGGKHVLSPRISKLFGLSLTSCMAMPLEGPEDVAIGAIGLYNAARPTGFSQDARALLRLISANVSTAVLLFRSRSDREKAQRLSTIGRFLSGVMHDLKTPMTIISGYVQLMAETSDPRARKEHAELLLKQLEVIGTMQRELLDFARGKRTLWIRKIYLVPFSQELERDVSREVEGTRVKLEVVLDDRGTARFDEHKLVRAIHNLVRNAIEAMGDKGGRLTIRLGRQDGDLLVSVSDTGRGIPAEIKDRLFGTFVTAGKAGGTGLGLSIVKKIVEEHEGRVDVSSGAAGTTFTLRLPQRESAAEATVEHGAATTGEPASAERALARRPSERPTAKRKARSTARGTSKGDAKISS